MPNCFVQPCILTLGSAGLDRVFIFVFAAPPPHSFGWSNITNVPQNEKYGKKYADIRKKLYYKRNNANSSKYSADNIAKLILW